MSSKPTDVAGGMAAGAGLLTGALQTVAQPVWVVDRDGLIRFANAAAVATLGYSDLEELIGRDSHQTIHHHRPDGRPYPAAECPMLRPRTTGQTVTSDLDWFFRRDGSMFRVSYVSAPLEMADGRGAVVAFNDIESRLRGEEALREREASLAEQQEALRRVATLVARGLEPEAVFRAVADEVHGLLGADISAIVRFETDGTATAVGAHGGPHAAGARLEGDLGYVVASVRETGQAARFDTDDTTVPVIPEVVRAIGVRSQLASPIVVDGEVWGTITVGSVDRPLPAAMEGRLADFTELVAAVISSAQAHENQRQLADEQAALRRVATLVAQGASPTVVFDTVAAELAGLLQADHVVVCRYESGSELTVLAHRGTSAREVPPGTRINHEGDSVEAVVWRTERSARLESYDGARGTIAELARAAGVQVAVGAPVVVDARLWGVASAGWNWGQPPPSDTEERMAKFADLVATAIANAEARAEVERLAEEQAALRRVATLVAEGAPATAVFDAVAAEIERVLGADGVSVSRFEPDDEVTVVAHSGADPPAAPPGTRVSIAEVVRNMRGRASVWAPIVVEGLWGVAIANWRGEEPPPADTEERMAKFAELLDTAIANADGRDQLTASRARLVTEADEARRRVVRDLHDGVQQRLLHAIMTLKLARRALQVNDDKTESLISEALEHARQGIAELRELAHGILPAVLTQGGLRAGVDTVVSRVDVPVDVDVPAQRFPREIEASAYFIVAEALTNIIKHSNAERAEVRAFVEDGMLHVEVRDDGIGGADPSGHGLVGLQDRVAALGGRLQVESPTSGGTLLTATLPLSAS
jgi:PAS domain S-box-containing protein